MNNGIDFMSLWTKYMPSCTNSQAYPMALYAVEGGGKRVRPSLLIDTASCMGQLDSNIERMAVALECIHSYSLVHDDLPCMDNDDMRRGKPSCHKQFGYAEAVLAGDYLLNSSAEVLFGGNSSSAYMSSCQYMFSCGRYMIEGQCIDIKGTVSSYEQYQHVAFTKTGALLRASLVCPAKYNSMSDIVIDKLANIGNMLGLMYQIADDLSDKDNKECSILNIYDECDSRQILTNLHKDIVCEMAFLQQNGLQLPYFVTLVDKLCS